MKQVFLYLIITVVRKLRKQLQQADFKRAARNPWRMLNVKPMLPLGITSINRDLSLTPAQPQEVVVLD